MQTYLVVAHRTLVGQHLLDHVRTISCRTTVDHGTFESLHRRLLDDRNWIRIERVEAAQARLEAGDEPSAEVVAEMMMRRAICDRLS